MNFFNVHVIFILAVTLSADVLAQGNSSKVFFDRNGKVTTEAQAYYYRQGAEQPNRYNAYYVNGNSLYFEGELLKADPKDEDENTYTGTCKWYHKNGKEKAVRTFNSSGLEDGTSNYYFESGKIWKSIDYENGAIVGNRIKEYDENGTVNSIFEELFDNNFNDWDLYTSDKSKASIQDGKLKISSFIKEGTSRYINLPSESDQFALEAVINISELKDGEKAGLIYGFKDWQNYNFYVITQTSFYIGSVYEGINSTKAEGMYSGAIQKKEKNNIKIIGNGEKNYYSINGELQYTTSETRNFGSKIGFAVSGRSDISIEKLIFKEIGYKPFNSGVSNTDINVKATGSGLLLNAKGYVVTNHHVVEDSKNVMIEINQGGVQKIYNAVVLQKDADNDVAIIKIEDESFSMPGSIPYSFRESGIDVGASVFTIGFPHALSGMGKEAKFTDGKVSAKTGYNNSLNSYQTSIPVQPGNSGGPLFNNNGELIGIINAKFKGGDNVSYAIKLNYIKPLIDLLPERIELPSENNLSSLSLEEQVRILRDYVVLIKTK